jgi:hypothetical protein
MLTSKLEALGEQSRNSPSWRKKSAEPIKIGVNKAFNNAV